MKVKSFSKEIWSTCECIKYDKMIFNKEKNFDEMLNLKISIMFHAVKKLIKNFSDEF